MISLRKNPQDSFRRSRKIVNRNEIPIGISAAMDYSRCCALVFILTFQLNAQEFLTHKVEEGDTVEALSKKYKVSANQIYDLTPVLINKLGFSP